MLLTLLLFADISFEQLLGNIVQLGLGTILSAAFIWFVHHIVTNVIPKILQTHHDVMKEEKEAHQAIIKEMRESHDSLADRLVERQEKMSEILTTIANKFDQVDRHVKANYEHVTALREYIIKKKEEGK